MEGNILKNKQAQIIKQMTDKEIVLNLYVTQLILFVVAVVLSQIIHKDWYYPFQFLSWELKHIFIGIFVAFVVVLLEIVGIKYLPEEYFDDGGINERVFRNRGPVHIVFLSLIVGFAEELLFRGVLQTTFGLIPATIIFALVHIRYLYNKFLFTVTLGLSLLLGLLYLYTGNLLTVIACHMFIDMILGWCIRYNVIDKLKKKETE